MALISGRLKETSSGQPKPRSASPNRVSPSSASSVASHVAAPSGLNSLMTGGGLKRCSLSSQARREMSLADRKSVVEGKSVSVRVDLGGRRILKQKIEKEK